MVMLILRMVNMKISPEYLQTSFGFTRFFFLLLDLNDVKTSRYSYTVISDTHLWLWAERRHRPVFLPGTFTFNTLCLCVKLFVISENCVKLCLKVFVALLELGSEWILYQTIKTIDVIKVQRCLGITEIFIHAFSEAHGKWSRHNILKLKSRPKTCWMITSLGWPGNASVFKQEKVTGEWEVWASLLRLALQGSWSCISVRKWMDRFKAVNIYICVNKYININMRHKDMSVKWVRPSLGWKFKLNPSARKQKL